MSAHSQLVVIGNPANRRIAFLQAALERLGRPPARVLSYLDVLADAVDWRGAMTNAAVAGAVAAETIVRLESPGEDFEVERLLLLRGCEEAAREPAPRLDTAAVSQLRFDLGRILHPRQWYLGYRRFLRDMEQALADAGARAMNHPADVAVMFDKPDCQARLAAAGLSIPPPLPACHSFDELVANMEAAGESRVFVKLAHGSSASGVVALEQERRRFTAVTTAELVRGPGGVRLYNSLKIRRYTQLRDVRDLLDQLCAERVQVEHWVPKARLGGQEFDLRIVVIQGRPAQLVVRQSDSPFTNLHLGNRRGDPAELRRHVGDHWGELEATCAQALSVFPRSLYAGVDIALAPDFQSHWVIELNAFGDLLPNVLDEQGRDSYTAELAAL